ncbi:SDR family oxidoreductase [Sphingobium sp. JS3065]|jgi:3-oxoacyl-[acyl-carrier protein] reductase|uniref:SDR family NAD(P)-dependent oxidoreductase n=1 Tax=Sphingobium sp. JS3065 TaxID=2970925 RepID=UPI00226530A4|nr:SDR family NAD(P)-dependent oxidoreductase [Sphingobium sp. JS3065]UZW57238.1 SDR family oxidoreductase [Sphingobium sp. JS3065]
MDMDLSGRTALVTGSSAGIGAAIAKRLASEGSRVVVHGRNADRAKAVADEIRASGGEARVVIGDLSTDGGAAAAVRAALDCWGGIDILVNNAGGPSNPSLNWDNAGPSDWVATFQLNVVSAVRMIGGCLPGMKERGWGRVIQIGSIAGISPAPFTIPDYSAAKAALHALTIHLAKSLAGSGVTANAVAPGLVISSVLEDYFRSLPGNAERAWEDIEKDAAESFSVKVGELTKPDHVASLVTYLASPLSAHVHGAVLRADGGILSSAA